MSQPNIPQEKIGKSMRVGIIVRLKMPSKRYLSAQMTRHFKQAPFFETTSKERPCNVMTLD